MRLFDRPVPLLALAMLFWSLNFVLGRAVRAEVPPVGLAFWRWAGATLLLLALARPHLRRDLPALRRAWPELLLLSFLGVAVFNTLVYVGLRTTVALNAFLMQSLMPVLIVGLSFLLFRERIAPRQLLGLALSLAGAIWVAARGDPEALRALRLAPGDALIFVAVACYAAYSVLLRWRPAVHPLSFLLATFAPGALMLLPSYLLETAAGRPVPLSVAALGSIAYVAVFPSVVSFLFFNRGVELIGANRAGLYLHLMPLLGSLLSVLLLGEAFRAYHALGVGLIASGIALASGRGAGAGRIAREG